MKAGSRAKIIYFRRPEKKRRQRMKRLLRWMTWEKSCDGEQLGLFTEYFKFNSPCSIWAGYMRHTFAGKDVNRFQYGDEDTIKQYSQLRSVIEGDIDIIFMGRRKQKRYTKGYMQAFWRRYGIGIL